jgi:hypothetical protein
LPEFPLLLLSPRLDVVPRLAEFPELELLPRDEPLELLDPERPEDEPALREEPLIPPDECESLSESPSVRVDELPIPSSLRLPRSLRPLVLPLLFDPVDELRSTLAAE